MLGKPPFVIVDNSLLDERGHHLALAATISSAAVANGHNVVWYTHHQFDPSRAPEGISTIPAFSASTYELFAQGRGQTDVSHEYIAVLSDLLAQHAGNRCIVLLHSADAHVYRALHHLQGKLEHCAPIEFHVSTPYELKLMPGSKAGAISVGQCLNDLRRSGVCETSLFLWGETERLAEYYRHLTRAPVGTLSLPAPSWANPDARLDRLGDPLTVAFLGAARDEKGFHKLPDVVRCIADDHELRDRVKFEFQCTPPIVGYTPRAQDAIQRLRAFEDLVRLCEHPLAIEQYANAVNNCDVVLFPYALQNYFARGSGVVIEAFSSGKYLVGQSGTFVDDMQHFGLACMGSSPEDWVISIREIAKDMPAKRKFASAAGKQFGRLHFARGYIERLLFRRWLKSHAMNIDNMGTRHRLPLLVTPSATR